MKYRWSIVEQSLNYNLLWIEKRLSHESLYYKDSKVYSNTWKFLATVAVEIWVYKKLSCEEATKDIKYIIYIHRFFHFNVSQISKTTNACERISKIITIFHNINNLNEILLEFLFIEILYFWKYLAIVFTVIKTKEVNYLLLNYDIIFCQPPKSSVKSFIS